MSGGIQVSVASRWAHISAVIWVVASITLGAPRVVLAQTKPPKSGTKDFKLYQELLTTAKRSKTLKGGWVVETPTHVVHSTISTEYSAAAAVHLYRFHKRFVTIFREEIQGQAQVGRVCLRHRGGVPEVLAGLEGHVGAVQDRRQGRDGRQGPRLVLPARGGEGLLQD